MKHWHLLLALLTFNVTLMGASYTMIMPFLPVYILELGASPAEVNLWSGAIYGSTFAVCAVMAPVWGRLSDRFGLKPMFVRAGFLMATTYFLSSLVTSPLQLLLARVLQGFSAGMWPAALGILSRCLPPQRLGLGMGLMQSAHVLGAVLGPLLGGVLAEQFGIRFSYRLGFAFYLGVTLLSLAVLANPPPEKTRGVQTGFKSLLKTRGILPALWCALCANLAIMMLQPVLTLYVGQLLGTESAHHMSIAGFIFSLAGIAGVVAAPVWGPLGQRRGFGRTLSAGMLIAGVFTLGQALPLSLVPFAVLQFLGGLGFAGVFPSLNSLMTRLSPSSQRGSAFGLIFAFQQVGGALGPLLGGALATLMALQQVFMSAGLLLIACGIFAAWHFSHTHPCPQVKAD